MTIFATPHIIYMHTLSPHALAPPLPPSAFSLTPLTHSHPLLHAHFPALPNNSPTGSCSNTIPTFNTDGWYFTPSFILGYDRKTYAQQLGWYLDQFRKKTTDCQQDRLKILLPKPSPQNCYCCVCNTPFQDYLTHTALPSHKELVVGNEYHKVIVDLCQEMSQKESRQGRKRHTAPKRDSFGSSTPSDGNKEGCRARKTRRITKTALHKRTKESCGEESPRTVEAIIGAH